MTTRDTAIEDAIAQWRIRLRLTDWDIRLDPDTSLVDDEDACAMTWIRDHQKAATIRVAKDTPDSQIARVVVHELVHIVMLDHMRLTNHVLAKCGDVALGVMDHLAEVLERICETMAETLTGIPWEPQGESAKTHAPFVIDHSLTRNTEVTDG